MKFTLNSSISEIGGVGKVVSQRLKKLGINQVLDLIFYYPFRYQDLSQILPISKLSPGIVATIKGKIQLISNRRSPVKRKILTEALIADKTGSIKVIWFNQPFLTKVLKPGDELFLAGKVDFDYYTLQLTNPIYEKVKVTKTTIHTARIVPIYSLTENLTQKQIRYLIKTVLPLINQIPDWLPDLIKKELNFYNLNLALRQIHFPENWQGLNQALKRLKFDELFLLQLQSQIIKKEIKESKSLPIKFQEKETKNFVNSLPFKLTDDQRKVAWEILKDLEKNRPMNRLLEGEVGSGKTVVAAIAVLNVALAGYQSVLMAPTEILASQHFKTIKNLLKNFRFKVAILTRSEQKFNQRKISKTKLLEKIKKGKVDIILGTHALIQEKINFKNLALTIVDEQHRFGVEQRKILREKAGSKDFSPHFLSMTATPIPRSLALVFYGDLDLSIISQLPEGRKKVITEIVKPGNRFRTYNFIREEIRNGRQVFVVCPLIDPSDKLGVKAVTQESEKLKKDIFPELAISFLHGKMKAQEKEKIMKDFLKNKIKILVSTSVIEVGVDIPNTSVMLIEGAERFGLAQLYQFRGRVGRAKHQAYCFLFTENAGGKTKQRLSALLTAENAFQLAEKDLEFRGPGEIFGTLQSGFPEFKLATLKDYELIQQAKIQAEKIIKISSNLENFPLLKQKIQKLIKPVHLE